MCRIDDGGEFTAFSSAVERRARKPHFCSECSRVIQSGEIYRYASGMFHGGDGFWDAKQCAHCRVAAEWLRTNCRGFVCHEVIEDFAEHATGRLDMLRIVVGAKRRWCAFLAAGLMPVPAYPRDMNRPEKEAA
jgi:hypothetical protein